MKRTFILSLTILFASILSACTPSSQDFGPRPFIGNADAPVLIEEFSDLQCPACAFVTPQVEDFVRANPNLARMEYYHFPLNQHEYAYPAAEGAECAADQGKFWEYVDLAFKNQKQFSDDIFYAVADQLGLDSAAFKECFDGHHKKDLVTAHLYEGRARGVRSTPSLFVNGQYIKFEGIEIFEAYVKGLAN